MDYRAASSVTTSSILKAYKFNKQKSTEHKNNKFDLKNATKYSTPLTIAGLVK